MRKLTGNMPYNLKTTMISDEDIHDELLDQPVEEGVESDLNVNLLDLRKPLNPLVSPRSDAIEDFKDLGEVRSDMGRDDWHQHQQVHQGADHDGQILFSLENLQQLVHDGVIADAVEPEGLFPDDVAQNCQGQETGLASGLHALVQLVKEESIVRFTNAQDQVQRCCRLSAGVKVVQRSH